MREHNGGESSGSLENLLQTKRVLVADGAMGTALFERGLTTGDSPELWNVTNPDGVAAVHQGYLDAGSDIILTNTFGGNRLRLGLHNLEERTAELNRAAARIARTIADSADRPIAVGGSVGPTGELFAPIGTLSIEQGTEIFGEQIDALIEGGCDVIWIETLSSHEEWIAATAAAERSGRPFVTTLSFDTNGHTMMGVSPANLTSWRTGGEAPLAVGANCGIGPPDLVAAVAEMHRSDPEAVVVAKGNCGIPVYGAGDLHYPTGPEEMIDYTALAIDAGARIVGACCGSSPDHIRHIREAVDTYLPGETPSRAAIEARLGPISRPSTATRTRTRKPAAAS